MIDKSLPLNARVAFITGGGRGIGRGAAISLAKHGANVSFCSRTPDELQRTAELIQKSGAECLPLKVDLTDPEDIEKAMRRTKSEFGPIDILINNAGTLHILSFEETSPRIWRETMEVNLFAAYYTIRLAYPDMIDRGFGHIHNVSSAAGYQAFEMETAYCASKFGLEGLSSSLALESAEYGISVVMSSPGKETKPTSLTMDQLKDIPIEVRKRWTDPQKMGDAFSLLAHVDENRLNGKRYNLHKLSTMVRKKGLTEVTVDDALECTIGPEIAGGH